jgi:hypothetical protein
MSKRKFLTVDIHGFEEMLTQIDKAGKEVKTAVEDALEQACETIGDDTYEVVANKSNLPAKGKYSTGETLQTIIRTPKTKWIGYMCEVDAGFKNDVGGAGLILITGTPRQAPARGISDIYASKKYQKLINESIQEVLEDYL